MSIREDLEKQEELTLSKYATLSSKSLGRDVPEEECIIRPAFTRDRDRILHSKAFRRLKHKTQVFLAPEVDHLRTRLTHTLEVAQIARTISKALRLNEDLTEAIALGHDLGHTPFGHTGERVLNKVLKDGFEHCVQSVRVVEKIENKGKGLNLTKEVRDGILNHRTSGRPKTLEGQAVRFADKIAYINHDIDDAIEARIMKEDDLPKAPREILGFSVKDRINTLIIDIINNSENKPMLKMSDDVAEAMQELRKWMFENVYVNSIAKQEDQKASELVFLLYNHYLNHIELMTDEYLELIDKGESTERVIADYISGMTDEYAIMKFNEYFVPRGWRAV